MKIDLHTHTCERSPCCRSTEEEQIRAAVRYGLDAIVITDHNKNVSVEHIRQLNEKYSPFIVFSGIEVSIKDTEEHILVIGVHDAVLQEKKWNYEDLYTFVKSKNGYIGLAHPYRHYDSINLDINRYVPDGVEIHSTNISASDGPSIKELADKLGIKTIANSDSHQHKHIGLFYNELNLTVKTEQELITQLKLGNYKLGSDSERVKIFNNEVRERELHIKQMINDGKTEDDYFKETGNWKGLFSKVARGKSYEI